MKGTLSRIAKHITKIAKDFEGSYVSVTLTVPILSAILVGFMLMGSGLPVAVDVILFCSLSFIILYIMKKIGARLLALIRRVRAEELLCFLMFGIVIFIYLYSGMSGKCRNEVLILAAILFTTLTWCLIKSFYIVLIKKRKKKLPIALLGISTVMYLAIFLYAFSDGRKQPFVEEYVSYAKEKITFENEFFYQAMEKGKEEVDSFLYGTSEEVEVQTKTMDLSGYVSGYKGMNQILRESYQGYDIKHVPLSGKVWYPKDKLYCPIVFVVHGNHAMTTPSFLGYEYIGEHLASKGYIVVSVDENVLNYYIANGLSGENGARAVLLLANMREILQQSKAEDSPLYDKVDRNSIALIGHSRGGEAVSLATLYNQLGVNPDNANLKYYDEFSIKSVIGVAPTVNQYLPSDKEVILQDINYLVVQGANDQDITSFQGVKQYNDVVFSSEKNCYKAYKYIVGANHGQFNTTWISDYDFPRNLMLNESNLLEGTVQRNLLVGYITSFLEDTLRGKEEYRSVFFETSKNEIEYADTVIISSYSDTTFQPIVTCEEDVSPYTTMVDMVKATASGMNIWREQKASYYREEGTMSKENTALYCYWSNGNAKYELESKSVFEGMPNKEKAYLQFDIADVNIEGRKNSSKEYPWLDFELVIEDGKENKAKVRLHDCAVVYPPIPIQLYKLQFGMNQMDMKTEFETVRIPIEEFQKNNPGVDTKQIKKISFLFNQTKEGKILLDNIGFASEGKEIR